MYWQIYFAAFRSAHSLNECEDYFSVRINIDPDVNIHLIITEYNKLWHVDHNLFELIGKHTRISDGTLFEAVKYRCMSTCSNVPVFIFLLTTARSRQLQYEIAVEVWAVVHRQFPKK